MGGGGVGSICSAAGAGAAATAAASSVCTTGLMVLTRRGGPSVGVAGLAGSGFFATGAFLPPDVFAGAWCSANMSPPGSAMLRWRATRSTNDRATTSSRVLEALFNSMP